MLETIADNIWLAEGFIVDFHGFPYPTRSVIVRLPSGDLWVWSPIALSDDLRQAIDALGPVAHLVSPNKIHHLFLKDWKTAYPDAKLWGPESTIRKRRDLSFEPALEHQAPPGWEGAIDLVWFQGSFFMDEVVFFHPPSSTAILADLSENFDDAFLCQHWQGWQRRIAKVWKITVGYGFAPLEWRLSFWHRGKARAALNKLLAWEPEKVIMAHGRWQPTEGTAFLKQAFAWLR